MTQPAFRGMPQASNPVTVADLLDRYSSAPRYGATAAETTAAPIVSVGALLRREGLPGAEPGIRTGYEVADQHVEPEPAPRRGPGQTGLVARRSTIAAGTLLAAGSLFGAVAVGNTANDSPAGADQALGSGHSGSAHQQDGLIPRVVDQGYGLDAGAEPPTSWLPVAFPTDTSGAGSDDGGPGYDGYVGSGAPDRGGDQGGYGSPDQGGGSGSAQRSSGQNGGGSAGGQDGSSRDDGARGGGSQNSGGQNSGGQNSGGSDQSNGGGQNGGGVGRVVADTGDAVGGPVGGVVSGVGDTVSGVGDGVSDLGQGIAEGGGLVTGTVGGTVDLVGSLL